MKEALLISECLLGEPCRYDGQSNALPVETLLALSERYALIPVCPEQQGQLPTPRTPSERLGDRVVTKTGEDVTNAFYLGARMAQVLVLTSGAKLALLKERSPSCGKGPIYDGTFTGTLTDRSGVTAEALMQDGVTVYGESEVEKLIE